LERQDQSFYATLAGNPSCSGYRHLFEQFAGAADKNMKTVQRARRENVTEMILEPIKGFTRAPYCEECASADTMSAEDALATARRLKDRAVRYYSEAAEKIKALPEVARGLKTIAKKHGEHLSQLAEL
jgi:hypothetical protein